MAYNVPIEYLQAGGLSGALQTNKKNTAKPLGELNRELGKTYTAPAQTYTPTGQPAASTTPLEYTTTPSVTDTYIPLDTATTPNINDMYSDLFDSQLQTRTAQIKSATESAATRLAKALTDSLLAKDEALNSLTGAYQQAKNRAAGQSDIGKYNYAQTAAAQGIEGNAAMQNELYSNVGLQNAIGGLDRSRSEQVSGIEREKAGLKTNYQTDITGLYNQMDQDILAAGGEISTQRTSALIDEALRQSDLSYQQQAQVRQDLIATMGRYAGKEDEAIAEYQNDGDTSNDWFISYLQAQKADRVNAQPTYSSRSSGVSGTTQSTPEAGIIDTMLSLGNEAQAYEYLVGLGLSQGKTDQLLGYYNEQKEAQALPQQSAFTPSPAVKAGVAAAQKALDYGTSPEDVLAGLNNGSLSAEEIEYIKKNLVIR